MWFRSVAFLIAFLFFGQHAFADDPAICGSKRVCGDMTTCAEAAYYNTECGLSDLDRNGNGIPCETICGKTVDVMKRRMTEQPYSPSKLTETAQNQSDALMQSAFSCGAKSSCPQMNSCVEATYYLRSCGVSGLDADSDGVPCEGLCR